METGLEKMRCGNCGESAVDIYSDSKHKTIIECCNCKNTTELVVKQPKISFEWHGKSDGVHSIF